MSHIKKLMVSVLVAVLALAFSGGVALAETSGTITVNNAAKGETYAVYKVLDATINTSGGIDYTGSIPSALANYLEVTSVGTEPNTYSAIAKKSEVSDDDLFNALKQFAADAENVENYAALVALDSFPHATASEIATGNSVTFSVAPGYYVVVSTQGTAVMIDSATNPAAVINEKNVTELTAEKTVEEQSYSIGDTVKYTATFDTANYAEGKPVTAYEITDTLPPFLSDAAVKSVTIGGTAVSPTPAFDNKKITIPWATYDQDSQTWTSIYNNGVQIVVKYEAVLTSTTNIGKEDKNTVTIKPTLGNNDGTSGEPTETEAHDSATIKTYAAALKKTDGTKALAGAEFQVAGLQATAGDEAGVWIVTSYDPESTDTPTTLTTDSNGKLYIVGLAGNAELVISETKAPDGYNKLNGTKTLTPQLMETTTHTVTTWEKYDADGNLIDSRTEETEGYEQNTNSLAGLDAGALEIVNNKGAELPSTGGMGTTILYIIGGIMVLLAVVFLITKKRVAATRKEASDDIL